ncbi:uncharacterized protein BX664DRAFT_331934 [Halteromyces radiatus]|uniref:uncharacterized protein n=1 Tax=Halteromyces radiatus TaxID=101107 RepID=UPI00222128F6|nr:uncharacterized protein BX664DRAFT_331934 [Halteromyces radiatus]KAI8088998.1 hypothetical protein BX664DRAFT_331934 [Halteromyces radiatus]
MPQTKEDASISFVIDDSFTGIMQGAADDESEGCTLSGQCVLQVHRPIKVRRLIIYFEGRCKVHLKKSSSYGMVSTPEASETRSLYSRQQHFLGQDGELHVLQPGEHAYYFSLELPSHLPASYQGKRGYIRYRLTCAIYRPMFSSDLRTSMDITIKRCLMSDLTPTADRVETVYGKKHTNKIRYSATAPTMAYREGGLIRLNLAMQLLHPEHYGMKSVTCALRERVQYRTTDSQAHTLMSRSDDVFPLGYSTFSPSQAHDYDPTKPQEYNALFRLIPRVNADTNSRLLKVTHSLVVNILLEKLGDDDDNGLDTDEESNATDDTDHHAVTDDEDGGYTSWASDQTDDKTRLSQRILQQHHDEQQQAGSSSRSSTSRPTSPSSSTNPPPVMTPPHSRASSPVLSRSSSSSSITSLFSLKNKSHDDLHKLENKVLGKHPSRKPGVTVCTVEVPLVVTSRQHTWDGHMPKPPSYVQTASEAPPGYHQTLETCPMAPNYNPNEEDQH